MHTQDRPTSSSTTGAGHHDRLVRYVDLKPCRNAFVDTRTPGSDAKENFTIVGPGVSENPNQHVHIPEPHGFNIGGARQPPGCLNSQHSHLTAEVFIVHSGRWVFRYGANADEGEVSLAPGDTISIPPLMFRGFENVGQEVGFLFAVLGGDDPGRVTWTPSVFELASQYGLVLLEGGRLVDTTAGELVPEGAVLEQPPTQQEIAALATPPADRLSRCVAHEAGLKRDANTPFAAEGVSDAPVIVDMAASEIDSVDPADGAIHGWWKHGFGIRRLTLQPQSAVKAYARDVPEVLFLHEGLLSVRLGDQMLDMHPGDTLSLPRSLERSWSNPGTDESIVYLVQGC